jgi:hypothetical protein
VIYRRADINNKSNHRKVRSRKIFMVNFSFRNSCVIILCELTLCHLAGGARADPDERKDKVMKNYPWRYVMMVVVVLLLTTTSNVWAKAPETVEITSPTEGGKTAGVLNITGSIDFLDFMKFELFLKTGGELLWAATVYAPVTQGTLAHLDTRIYPDGMYQLVMRTVKTDSNYKEYTGPSFVIENNLGAPRPYPEIESSPLYLPTAGALARIRNCSGDNLNITYGSPGSFCSADDLWIPFKNEHSPLCPYVDVLLIPNCEYRGTAMGQGQPRGANYSFKAEQGKLYELNFAGGDRLFINQLKGETPGSAVSSPASQSDQSPPAAAADTAKIAPPAAVTSTQPATSTKPMLPVSGAGQTPKTTVILGAVGVLLLLLIGGIVALRRRGNPA